MSTKESFMIPVFDEKLDEPVTSEYLSNHMKDNLEHFKGVGFGDKSISILIRNQHEDGRWYFALSTLPLDDFQSGDSIHLTKTRKVVVE